MKATIKYTLSEAGRRAALAAGLDGRRDQVAVAEVGNGDLELFCVAADGTLSADGTIGAEKGWRGWRSVEIDSPLDGPGLIAWLRRRQAERAAVEAAEAAEAAAAKAADAEQRQAGTARLLEALRAALAAGTDLPDPFRLRTDPARIDGPGGAEVGLADYPEVAQYAAYVAAKTARAEAAAKRLAAIEQIGRPTRRPVVLQPDGTLRFDVPEVQGTRAWAKQVDSFDATAAGGYAFEGPWLRPGAAVSLGAGELIVAGNKSRHGSWKRGDWQHTLLVYCVTPIGLRPLPGVPAAVVAAPRAERVRMALEAAIRAADDALAGLATLAADPEYAPEAARIEERAAAWRQLAADARRALEAGAGDEKVTDVESAASAIVTAGFRVLAKVHHPDAGGSHETMVLVSEAARQLREMLRVAGSAR